MTRALGKLGADIQDARRRRRIPAALLAERAQISRTTLHKVEQGAPGVSMANYASVLHVLGLLQRLNDLADARNDPVGLNMEAERLPQRVRAPRAWPQHPKKP